MKTDCRNDCEVPSRFPRLIFNRAGLSRIDYRIGAYADFKGELLRQLDRNVILGLWTHRGSDDPGIALLEGASILADILTFYQDFYANQVFLPTATSRESIGDLARFLGYRLSPGVGGKATFAFEVSGNAPVVVPKGFAIEAQLEKLDDPAGFETSAEMTAYPPLSRFHLFRPSEYPSITAGSSRFSIETSELQRIGIELSEGDRLMLVSDPPAAWQIAVVAEASERFERTEIAIEGSWQGEDGVGELSAYKLGRSFRCFGYNAPEKETVLECGTASQRNVGFCVKAGDSFHLDQEVDDLAVGALMVVSLKLSANKKEQGNQYFFQRSITKVTAGTKQRGDLTGGTSVVYFEEGVSLEGLTWTDIRTIEFHEVVASPFSLKSARAPLVSADRSHLYYYGDATTYQQLNGRSLQFCRGDQTERTRVTIDGSSPGSSNASTLRRLTLNPPLQSFSLDDFPLEAPVVAVYGNLVEATQGKKEREVALGNGDSRQVFQTFKLPKAPLTYHTSPGETPPEVPELGLYVNDRLWTRVPSFFGRQGDEQVYVVREDADGDSWVQFGDGKTGARLPSGLKNVVAKYRTGAGAHGPLKEGTTVQPGARLDRLDKIHLLGEASGGTKPETGANAKEAAPGKVQSLGRLVSLADFETEALAVPGVSRARAAWQLRDDVPTVAVTVLMETGRAHEVDDVEGILDSYDRCRGAQRFPVKVYTGRRSFVHVAIDVAYKRSFRTDVVDQAIRQALGVSRGEDSGADEAEGLFSLARRQFGQREYSTRIEGTVQNVPGVEWAKVTELRSLEEANDPSNLDVSSSDVVADGVIPCGDRRVLSLRTEHLVLNPVTAERAEECADA